MGLSSLDYEHSVRVIGEAPFQPGGWDKALGVIQAAGGGWGSQLMISSTKTGVVLLNKSLGISADIMESFERHGGLDATINPRANMFTAPLLQVLGDNDFQALEKRRRNSFYVDFANVVDCPFIAMGRVPTPPALRVIVTATRSASAGHIVREDLELFQALLLHVGAAVRLQLSLDADASSLAAGALDAVDIPAFLINAWGRVVAQTAQADGLLRNGVLQLRAGRLTALDVRNDNRLQMAVTLACCRPSPFRAPPQSTSVLLAPPPGGIVAEVAPLPQESQSLRLGAVAVVAFPRRPRGSASAADLLTSAFGLSQAEAQAAIAIAKGESVRAIADRRGVGVETVRSQLKAAFLKLAVSSQTQLANAVTRLLGDL